MQLLCFALARNTWQSSRLKGRLKNDNWKKHVERRTEKRALLHLCFRKPRQMIPFRIPLENLHLTAKSGKIISSRRRCAKSISSSLSRRVSPTVCRKFTREKDGFFTWRISKGFRKGSQSWVLWYYCCPYFSVTKWPWLHKLTTFGNLWLHK